MMTRTQVAAALSAAAVAAGMWMGAGRQARAEAAAEQPAPALETLEQKASYAIGARIGKDLRKSGAEFDLAAFVRGFEDGLKARSELMTAEDQEKAHQELFSKIQKELPERNQRAADAFLAENGKREGVKQTASGLQYQVLKDGDGDNPKATDTVKVHYRGTLEDGTEFDSSYKRGQPVSFPLNGVIAAWTEGVQLMKVGGKTKLFVPPNLGYGERGTGRGGPIGPNQLLIFEIELLGIE